MVNIMMSSWESMANVADTVHHMHPFRSRECPLQELITVVDAPVLQHCLHGPARLVMKKMDCLFAEVGCCVNIIVSYLFGELYRVD